jgi:threonine synthase
VPDAVFVGVGDGCIMAGLHKGFSDLLRMGRVARLPRLYGVQAAGSDFLCQAWEEKRFDPAALLDKAPILPRTVADSLSTGLPRDRVKAMNAVRGTGGRFVRVSDNDILAAVSELARSCGVFAEPAGAACLAGLKAALSEGFVAPGETVCLAVTGSGLKDPAALEHAPRAGKPIPVEPSPEALEKALTLQPAFNRERNLP